MKGAVSSMRSAVLYGLGDGCSTSPQVKSLYSVTIMSELSKKSVHSLCLGVE